MDTTGAISPVSGSTPRVLGQRRPEQDLKLGQRLLDRRDRIVHVRRRGHVGVELVLRVVVPARRDPPGPAGGGLELTEVQLTHLVRAGGLGGERGPAPLGQFPAFALVFGGQDQPFFAKQPQHCGLGNPVAVVASHRPDLPVAPPARALRPPRGRAHGPVVATGPSGPGRSAPWPASVAKCVRARRRAGRTSKSICPPPSGSPRGPGRTQPTLRGLLPHPNLHRGLTQSGGQVGDLLLKLLFPARGLGLAGLDAGPAAFQEVGLLSAYGLLGNLLSAGALGDRHLALEHGQHDAGLPLRRNRR